MDQAAAGRSARYTGTSQSQMYQMSGLLCSLSDFLWNLINIALPIFRFFHLLCRDAERLFEELGRLLAPRAFESQSIDGKLTSWRHCDFDCSFHRVILP